MDGNGRGPSPLAAALDRIGDRWSLLVVEALLDGPQRFGELQGALPAIAPNILAERLRRLARDGVLVAAPYSHRPVRLSYALTVEGRDLGGALRLLADWGARRDGAAEPLRHTACGTALEAHWFCPTCDSRVDSPENDDVQSI